MEEVGLGYSNPEQILEIRAVLKVERIARWG